MEQVIKMALHRSDLMDPETLDPEPGAPELSPTASVNVAHNMHNPNYMDDDVESIHFMNNPLANAILLSNKTFKAPLRKPTIYARNFSRPTPTTIFNLPQRLLRWIYSMSMVVCILLMLGFIAVTPLDVIVQTLSTGNDTAVKTFIVIIVCVVFLFVSIIIYLARVYQFRVSLNDIPTKSLYIPFENDFPRPVFRYIDDNLQRCSDIKFKAGPLQDEDCIINHPGLSPPEYVQKINATKKRDNGEGTLLPPNVQYEDIIRSLGDKFYMGKILTQDDIPIELSMKEIIIYLAKQCMEYDVRNVPNLNRLIELYENFRFNDKLIKEEDIFEFMIEFDKFGQICQNDYQSQLPRPSISRRMSKISHNLDFSSDFFHNPSSYSNALFDDDEYDYNQSDDDWDDDDDEEDGANVAHEDDDSDEDDFYYYRREPRPPYHMQHLNKSSSDEASPFQHHKVENRYFANATSGDDEEDVESGGNGSVRRLDHRGSFSSSKSVIRNRLALESRHTLSNINPYGHGSRTDDEDDYNSLHRNRSGYVTDEEDEDSDEQDEEEDHQQFYQFRRRRPPASRQQRKPTDLNISPVHSVKSVEVKPIYK